MNYVYTTLLGTDDYLPGVMALYWSLQNVNAQYPLKVMVVDTVSTETITTLNGYNIDYEIIADTPFALSGIENPFYCTLNKFQFLNWTQYDKILFLDADTIVMENPDNLFELAAPAAQAQAVSEPDAQMFTSNIMLFEPLPSLWTKIAQLTSSKTIMSVNTILNDFIRPYITITPISEFPYFFHDCGNGITGGETKYWSRFNLTSFIDLEDFVNHISDYTAPVEIPTDWEETPVSVNPIGQGNNQFVLANLSIPIEVGFSGQVSHYVFTRRP